VHLEILHKELFLVHFGRFTWGDIQQMSVGERDWFYDQLVEVKKKQDAAFQKK